LSVLSELALALATLAANENIQRSLFSFNKRAALTEIMQNLWRKLAWEERVSTAFDFSELFLLIHLGMKSEFKEIRQFSSQHLRSYPSNLNDDEMRRSNSTVAATFSTF
jgi:hypothetical protein